MQKPQSWREILSKSIETTEERLRIAHELGVNPVTLTRWLKQESTPRIYHLQRLPAVIPQYRDILLNSIEQDIPGFTQQLQNGTYNYILVQPIPVEFYTRVLHTQATTPKALRFNALCDLILGQILQHFDPSRNGLAVIVASCMPPLENNLVRSLRERRGRGTPPWNDHLEQQAILLGAESLAGYAVNNAHTVVNPDLHDTMTTSPGYPADAEQSAVAAPIMRDGDIAGCLLLSSVQRHFFYPEHLQVLQGYAELLGLAFEDSDFYRSAQIDLWPLPRAEVQQHYLQEFRPRVLERLIQATREQRSLPIPEAELQVWREFEQTFFLQQI